MINKQNINFFEKIIGKKNIYSDPGDCWSYGYDNSKFHELPEAVLFPKDKNQLKNIVEYCYKKKINIAPRGRGTGNTGGSVPLNKCIVISFERMDKIIKIDIKNHISFWLSWKSSTIISRIKKSKNGQIMSFTNST